VREKYDRESISKSARAKTNATPPRTNEKHPIDENKKKGVTLTGRQEEEGEENLQSGEGGRLGKVCGVCREEREYFAGAKKF